MNLRTLLTRIDPRRFRRLPRRVQAAILAAIAAGGAGTVVVVNREPPPPVVNTAAFPKLTSKVYKESGAIDLPKSSVGVHYTASAPAGHTFGMVTLLGYKQGIHAGVVLEDCLIEAGADANWGGRWYETDDLVVRRTSFQGAIKEHYIYGGPAAGGLYEDLQFGELGKKNAGGAWCQQALRNIVIYRKDSAGNILYALDANGLPDKTKPLIEHDYSMETGNAGVLLSQQESTRIYRRIKAHHISWAGSPRQGAFGLSEHYAQLWLVKPDGSLDKSRVHGFINTHIVIEDCEFIGGHMDYVKNGVPVKSNRQLLVQGRPSLTMTGTKIDAPYPEDDWLGRVNNVGRVVIRDCELIGGKLEITDPASVVIEDCSGTTWVVIKIKGKTVYQGSVENGWTL